MDWAAVTMMMEMTLAIRAYSIAVVPRTSRTKNFRGDRAAWVSAANRQAASNIDAYPLAAPI
jgi:hypothetical protein